jgi:SAM-dependent methyltransferase
MDQGVMIRVPCPLCGCRSTHYERTVRGFTLERCRRCRFVFANPRYGPDELINEYQRDPETYIATYDRLARTTVAADSDRILGELEALVPGRGRLLDVGRAAGHFFERAAGRGWEAHGVDPGEWTRQAAAARGLENLHVGLLADQNFPDGYFDVVTSIQVVEHLPRPRDDFAEVRRVLRVGGVFYVNVPNYNCLSIVLNRDDFELNSPMGHVNYFTPGTLRRMLSASGFEVLSTSTYGGLKWENLLGRRIVSDQSAAYRNVQGARDGGGAVGATGVRRGLKALIYPLVRDVLYRRAQVGMSLEAFARQPDGAPGGVAETESRVGRLCAG